MPHNLSRPRAVRTAHRRLIALAAASLVGLASLSVQATGAAATDGNLVVNGFLERGTPTTFEGFGVEGWGDSAVQLGRVAGVTGQGAEMKISGWTQGDRKFMIKQDDAAPLVVPNARYVLSVKYKSTLPVHVTMFRHSAAGWTYWTDLKQGPAASTFTELSATTPQIPAGTDRLAWGLTIIGNGTLTMDDFSMTKVGEAIPPLSRELVTNGSLSTGRTIPDCYTVGGWGSSTRTTGFSTDTRSGQGRSYRISLANHSSGDYKLMPSEQAQCAPAVTPQTTYTASLWYKSTSPKNGLTFFKHDKSGWSYWTDLAALPATNKWTRVTATLPTIPAGVDRITFGMSVGANGTLLTDDYSLVQGTEPLPDVPFTGPAAVGRWSVMDSPLPVRAIHSTLLSNGKVLLIAGSGNSEEQFNRGQLDATLWDPVANTFQNLDTPVDLFCSGHVTLPDGRVLIMGGNRAYPGGDSTDSHGNHRVAANYEGLKDSFVFDPKDNSFTRTNDAQVGHWYPTLTKLENGNVWAAGGLGEDSNGVTNTELFDWKKLAWLPPGDGPGQVPQTWSYWGTYPHMFLLDDGRLFYTGGHTFGDNLPGTGARLYDWRTKQMWDVPGLRDKQQRDQAGSVLLPPAQEQKVLITGGGHTEAALPGVPTTDIIDLSVDNPSYAPGPPLPGPGKIYVNMTNLPDRTVLASNGAESNRADDVMTAAIFTPSSNSWTEVMPDPIGRNYHSSALLLPDGRVAVFGSNPNDNSFEKRISIFEPPYLFRGARPTTSGTPAQATYGGTFTFHASGPIKDVSLVAPTSATHQTDTNARLVDVPFKQSGTTITATLTSNPAMLPPGPYLLYVTTAEGTVSVGKWVMVK